MHSNTYEILSEALDLIKRRNDEFKSDIFFQECRGMPEDLADHGYELYFKRAKQIEEARKWLKAQKP